MEAKKLDAKVWLDEILDDLRSVIEDDPDGLKRRNERFGSYLVFMSTLISRYRFLEREQRDLYEKEIPRPNKGVTQWQEARDSRTAHARYWGDYLTQLHRDIETRISTSQTALNWERQALQRIQAER